MRPSRFSILSQPTGIVHLFWKCHNGERLLERKDAKELFFKSLIFGLKHRGTDSSVKLHAFCLMSNHVHEQVSFVNGAVKLSHFMRVSHGIFGRLFNNLYRRSGKVANERPKTPLIGDIKSQMRVHLYIEANPVRAKMVKIEGLRTFLWNSYRYYAHGDVDEYTKHLSPPDWYLGLGATPEKRQSVYRVLFREYVESTFQSGVNYLKRFIGSSVWVKECELALRLTAKLRRGDACARTAPG